MSYISVSIVVVSLNTRIQFLHTMNSIANQKNKDFEVIVVDGESKDGTVDEILKLKNKINKLIIEKDEGIYDAMNKGIKLASGKWIMFLNSGDTFFNDYVLENIFSKGTYDKDVLYGDTIIKSNNIKYSSLSKNFDNQTIIMPFCHQSCFVKNEILKKNLFNTNYKLSADFNLFNKLYLKQNNFQKINQFVSTVISGGVADQKRQQVLNENIIIIKKSRTKKNLYSLYLLKLTQYLKDVLKIFLPKKIWLLILKAKYRKRITQ